jgi:hypothetical protein
LARFFERHCSFSKKKWDEGFGLDYERALMVLAEGLEKPNLPLVSELLRTPYKFWLEHWLLMMLPPKHQQNFWDSVIELFCITPPISIENLTSPAMRSPTTDYNRTSDEHLLYAGLYAYSIPWPWVRYAPAECPNDPVASEATSIVQQFMYELRRRNKEPNESFLDLMFRCNPELGLNVMYQAQMGTVQYAITSRVEIDHVVHFVQVASARIRMQRAQRRDIELAHEQLRWLLRNYPDWWSKRYVVEVLLRDPQLTEEELLHTLRKEQHPRVAKRFGELEKKLREDLNAMPKPR